jgi:hypothetical protein
MSGLSPSNPKDSHFRVDADYSWSLLLMKLYDNDCMVLQKQRRRQQALEWFLLVVDAQVIFLVAHWETYRTTTRPPPVFVTKPKINTM